MDVLRRSLTAVSFANFKVLLGKRIAASKSLTRR